MSTSMAPFIEANAEAILSHPDFPSLCDTTVAIIYQLRLKCSETLKFLAAVKWSDAEGERRHLSKEQTAELLRPLVYCIDLKEISPKELMHVVLPSGAVANDKVSDSCCLAVS